MSELEAKKVLLARARQIGLEIDGRWSVDTLAEKVEEALETLEIDQNEAVFKASDTWVYPIRDCFLGTEKQIAGKAFKAPKELYTNWKVTGAARLADEDEIAKAQAPEEEAEDA
jgi:hypothetical protein